MQRSRSGLELGYDLFEGVDKLDFVCHVSFLA